MTTEPGMVEVDADQFKKEAHNYIRTLLGICAACVIAVAGSYIYNLQWQSRVDERLNSYGERLTKNETSISELSTELNKNSTEVKGRLGVIEERTGNMVDGIKRIEGKIDKK